MSMAEGDVRTGARAEIARNFQFLTSGEKTPAHREYCIVRHSLKSDPNQVDAMK